MSSSAKNKFQYDKRKEIKDQRDLVDRQNRIADYLDQQDQLERVFNVIDERISWKATVVFAVLSELIECLENVRVCTLMDIYIKVGKRQIRRPSGRVVLNMYTSWRLSRRFDPMHRGRVQLTVFDRFPILRRKGTKWTRRRIFKRKKDEPELTALQFQKYMNDLFTR